MKAITKPTTYCILLLMFLTSCTKDALRNPTPPGEGPTTPPNSPAEVGSVRFTTAANLAGQPYHTSNLHAVVTIVNSKNEEVVTEKVLALNLDGTVSTQHLQLPVGNYKLTRFRMVYGGISTHFAAPFAGSSKASMVQKPLAVEFKVEKAPASDVAVEVVRVQENEKPQHYGYPTGAFDNGQEDASPFLKVKIRAIMKIGDVVYDSIPAALRLSTWNDKGEMTTTYTSLAPGVNLVQVSKSATKYEFVVSKWGTNDAITLNRQDVDEATVYTLGGSKEAKKLKSETVYKIVDGKDVAESKTNYFYDHTGNLLKIDYWLKKTDNSPYLSTADWFDYAGGKVSKIRRVNVENNATIKTTNFTYDTQGRIAGLNEVEGDKTTTGTAHYLPSQQTVEVLYNLPSGHKLNYNMTYNKGNVIYTTAANSNSRFEESRYSYDFGINPYKHMNRPDLFFSNSSKNNLTSQNKTYNFSFPTAEPYSLFYKYDAEGYPTEVVKNYKSFSTGGFVFTTKTVFVY